MIARIATPSQGQLTVGVIFVLIGCVQLLSQLAHGASAPLLLVGIGAFLLWQATRESATPVIVGEDGTIADVSFLGHVKRQLPPVVFRGGSATSVVGSIELDLTRVTFGPEPVQLEVVAVLGSVALRVPAGCELDVRVTPVLGEIDNKMCAPAEPTRGARLVLTGCVVLGSVVVTS